MDLKTILGILAIVVGFIGYAIYLPQVIAGKTKPHAFSWFVWGILVSIIFAAQYLNQGAAGSWVTAFTALFQIIIFGFAIWKGERSFSRTDWSFLLIAIISLVLWYLSKDPTLSVLLITLTDFFAFLPTLRKGWAKPHEDSVALWSLTGLKWAISLIALSSYSFITLVYPVYLFMLGTLYSIVLLIRRKHFMK